MNVAKFYLWVVFAARIVTVGSASPTMTAEEYYKSAWVKISAQDIHGALTDLDRAIEADPRHLKALINRGNLLISWAIKRMLYVTMTRRLP
jgi:hypothetical protein